MFKLKLQFTDVILPEYVENISDDVEKKSDDVEKKSDDVENRSEIIQNPSEKEISLTRELRSPTGGSRGTVYANPVAPGQLRTDFGTNHTFETDGGQYTIESALKRYQVTATENVIMNNHCMGSLLVKGNLTGWGSGFSDGNQITDLASSYIRGSVAGFNGKCATRGNSSKEYPALYLGSSNNVQDTHNKWEQYIVNGKTAYNNVTEYGGGGQHGNEVAVTDNYVDWNRLNNALKAESVAISNSITNTPQGQPGETLTIHEGDRITIPDISRYSEINFIGSMTSPTNTVVNILNNGNVNLPSMFINGAQPTVQESDVGNAIVWNLSKANNVKIPNQNWVGHVIAPNADVSMDSGNYNGGIICKNFTTSAEGHLYPYNGGSILPDDVGFKAKKTVDGNTPSGNEKFTFKLYEAGKNGNNSPNWNNLTEKQSVQNNGGDISFNEITYSSEGTFYYQIKEVGEKEGYVIDNTIYYIKVVVTKHQSGQDIVYKATATYYSDPGLAYSVDKDDVIFKNKTKPSEFDLNLLKIDGQTGEALKTKDFEFKLKKSDGGYVSNPAGGNTWTTDENGYIYFEKLAPGNYLLQEKKGPQTYSILTKDITFNIGSGGKVTLTGEFATENDWVKILPENSLGISTLQVKNYKYISIPETGSNSLIYCRIIGILSLLIGIIILLRERRRLSG